MKNSTTFDSIIRTLSEKFSLDGPHDISPFFGNNGDMWLYNFIKEHHKAVFNHDDRFVMYFDKDEHLYGSNPGKLIVKLQQVISEIDISNFFVVLITTDNKSHNDALVVSDIYSTDDIPMKVIAIDEVNCLYSPKDEITPSLCVDPWHQLHIGTGGDILPCCDSVHSIPIGNVKDSSVIDIINSDKFNSIRDKMLNHERPLECATCYDVEDAGLRSKRNRINEKYQDEYDAIQTNYMDVRRLNINLGSTCNFKCRMCTGFSSSRLRVEEKKLNTHGDLDYPIFLQHDIERVLPEILSLLKNVDSVLFAGGESLLITEYNVVLEELIKLNKTDIDVVYSTNLSILPPKAMQYWGLFKRITVIASIDSDGEHAEYYRYGTNWEVVFNNFKILKLRKNIDLKIRSTISIYNAFRLIPLQVSMIVDGLIKPDDMLINIIEHPDYISIQVLPPYYRNQLNGLIDEHIEFLSHYNSTILVNQWKTIQKFLVTDRSFKLDKFFKYTDKLDAYRGENFELQHPEYAKLRLTQGE